MSGTNKKLCGGGFHHVFLKVKDLNKSIEFYKALGFVEKTSWGEGAGRMVLMDTGDGNYFELGQGEPEKGGGIFLHVALRTDDCDKAMEVVRSLGAEITVEPKSIDLPSNPPMKIKIAFFKGPDGEVIELFQNELT